MKISFKTTFTLCSVFILFLSCSKDKAMERHLYKTDGEWEIDYVSWTIVRDSIGGGQSTTSGSTANAGKFIFDDPGTGAYNFEIENLTESSTFNWTVNDEKAIIEFSSQSTNPSTGTLHQKTVSFSGTQPSKKKLTLEGSETNQYTGGSSYLSKLVVTATFALTKQ